MKNVLYERDVLMFLKNRYNYLYNFYKNIFYRTKVLKFPKIYVILSIERHDK